MTLRSGLFAAAITFSFALGLDAQAQDATATIKSEIRALEKKANADAANAAVAGKPAFNAKQSERLFDSLKISSGVSPGEERVGFVVCTEGGVSMGNIRIPQCRVEVDAPAAVVENCKELAKAHRAGGRSAKQGH